MIKQIYHKQLMNANICKTGLGGGGSIYLKLFQSNFFNHTVRYFLFIQIGVEYFGNTVRENEMQTTLVLLVTLSTFSQKK